MAFVGDGFYAMWNDMDPALVPEFNLMHARSHMMDHLAYLGDEGILAARRHGQGVGTLPPYFTFYDMRSIDLLMAPDRQHCRVRQTPWFLALRPQYRDHIRHHCRLLGRAGAGVGGSVATVVTRLGERSGGDKRAAQALCEELLRRTPVTAAHLGVVDPLAPTLVGGTPAPRHQEEEPIGVLVMESYDRYALAREVPAIGRHLEDTGVAVTPPRTAHYSLSLAVEYCELRGIRQIDERPGKPDQPFD